MKLLPALLCGLLTGPVFAASAAPTPAATPAPTPAAAKLRWQNGELLPGEPTEASETALTWKTALFEEPVVVNWSALRRLDRPVAATPVTEPFKITLRDGSALYGDVRAVTADTVSIRSARHGDAVLRRAEILELRRVSGGKVIFAGPTGDAGWDLLANVGKTVEKKKPNATAPIPPVAVGRGGALVLPYWNTGVFLEVALPASFELGFRVRSTARPDFQLALALAPGRVVSIDIWDGDLVLVSGDEWRLLRRVAAEEREISLRVCWDAATKSCSVFAPSGELLTTWQPPENATPAAAKLVLQNKSRDLTLDWLRLRTWDGQPPERMPAPGPRVELADGRSLAAQIGAGTESELALQPAGTDGGTTAAWSEIEAVIFSEDAPRPQTTEAVLSFADGTFLRGRVTGLKDGDLMLATSFSAEPLRAKIDGLRQVLLPESATPEPPLAELDKLTIEQSTLHGRLIAQAGDQWPRWLPVGGVTPVTLSRTASSEITRALPKGADLFPTPALLYTTGGDALPVSLRTLDRTTVEFASGLVERTRLPVSGVDAIQFEPAAQMSFQGFGDAAWRVLRGDEKSARKTNETLHLEPGTVIGHPLIAQSDEIQFTLATGNFCSLRLRLFCSGTDFTPSWPLLISNYGDELIAGVESDGEGGDGVRSRVTPGKPVTVRLVLQEKQVELWVNGVSLQRFPVSAKQRAGSGLVLEPASLWGNQVSGLDLTEFSAQSARGRTWLPAVSRETKMQALTVPRFRKDDPPRHVLLAANGDVLRGEIEALTPQHFGFRSGLENLRVPRDRVKAVIWLKKPLSGPAPAAAAKSPTLARLEQRITERTRTTNASLQSLISILQSFAADLEFAPLPKPDGRKISMQFSGQTIAEALTEICSNFGLSYRVDAEGKIVLEPPLKVSKDLSARIYWVKAEAFPDPAAAQQVLAAKGVPFPAGASARWQPEAQQLSMTNTPANHLKLTEVLDAEFGGNLGSPTHWLLLTNGARLGLAVDEFAPDTIVGHHPLYGRCTIPVAAIATLRTSAPAPAPVMRALADWRLVPAPEPVIAGAGGDSSPLLGQPAKPFKLPLLAGGNFELGAAKGKVVVLDFWATWCGPCINSLPGLIETLAAFPAEQVQLIGVDQGEPAPQVKRFIETRGWKLTVALDAEQTVGRQYGAEGIPHTVIIGPDGKVAWVRSGAGADVEVAEVVKRLLAPAPAAPGETLK